MAFDDDSFDTQAFSVESWLFDLLAAPIVWVFGRVKTVINTGRVMLEESVGRVRSTRRRRV